MGDGRGLGPMNKNAIIYSTNKTFFSYSSNRAYKIKTKKFWVIGAYAVYLYIGGGISQSARVRSRDGDQQTRRLNPGRPVGAQRIKGRTPDVRWSSTAKGRTPDRSSKELSGFGDFALKSLYACYSMLPCATKA